jgi:Peptidase family M41
MQEHGDRAFIAYHEAGHAVVGLLFEHDIGQLTIVQDGEVGGHAEVDRAGDDELRYEDAEANQVIFERRIMALMAGEIAQRRFDPSTVEHEHGASDRIAAEDYFDALDTPTDEIHAAYRRLLELRTAALLDQHWDRVKRIAAKLIAQGTISPEEAESAFVDQIRPFTP